MNKCQNCGSDLFCYFRYCPTCGAQIYVNIDKSLKNTNPFIYFFNSLYNLLADKNHPKRAAYISHESERVIARRCKIEYQEDINSMSRRLRAKFAPRKSYEDIYQMTLSNTLSGYVYRSVEEVISGQKSKALLDGEID